MNAAFQLNVVLQATNFDGVEFDDKYLPYQRMANAIIYLTQKNGECFPCDLLEVGFSGQETEERWHMADVMAAVELRLMEKPVYSFDRSEVRYASHF